MIIEISDSDVDMLRLTLNLRDCGIDLTWEDTNRLSTQNRCTYRVAMDWLIANEINFRLPK